MASSGLVLWALLFTVSAFQQACSQEEEEKETGSALPNIVFMMADDLGYGDVGYNGGIARTPNLDSMARGPNTIHLTRYYSGGPVCSPTRGSVLTGRNPNRYCMWYANVGSKSDDFVIPQRMPLPATELTVAETLKSAGYRTALFGKWHLGDLKPVRRGNPRWPVSHPGMHGFDEWLATGRSAPTHNLNCACFENASSNCQPTGHYKNTPPCSNYYFMDVNSTNLEQLDAPIRGDDSMFLLNRFERFLDKAVESDKPFFVLLSFHSAHTRYIASPEDAEPYLDMQYNQNHADYYGTITAMDRAVGGVRRLLQQHNISQNTMVWFTSDNGPWRSSPGSTGGLKGYKRDLHEGGIRVPGLIEWPAMITENRISHFPVVSSDLFPTVGDIIGNQTSTNVLDGVSILPMIRNEQHTRNSTIKWAYKIPANFSRKYKAAISGDRYKVFAIYDNDKIVSASLHDLTVDPKERVDLKASNVEEFEALKQELEEWRQSVIHSAKHEVQCFGNFTGEGRLAQ
jgi:arylsulfatase A-like enzyme